MKRYLLTFLILIGVGSLLAQTPTVNNLSATGTNVKWYNAATGGTAYTGSETLVNGQHYYASQIINGVESTSRLDVIATVTTTPTAPVTATHTASQTQIVWNWNTVSGATGYKWNTSNDYASATDLGNVLTKTEALACGTSYTRYVWAYNASGCYSSATTLTQTTASCLTAPSISTSAVSNIGSTSATLNGNITNTGGANVTVRGFKYSTTNNFDPLTSGTILSESGSFGTGTFTANLSGLSTTTTYYIRSYATNSIGTTYGDQVSFTSLIQTDFSYTGGVQTFVVPAGVTSVTIEAWGAQGWSGTNTGGKGGYATGVLSVSQGQVLNLYVGGQGTVAIGNLTPSGGGWNGGGNGQTNDGVNSAGGGGGASDVRVGGTTLTNRVIVAGGGGGSTNNSACSGGDGGGLIGLTSISTYENGQGGTQSAGGTTGGSLGQGGNATTTMTPWNGGGGGGYYGGGVSTEHGPGGGGSSYIGGVTSASTTAGQRTGNGRIVISY